MKPPPGDDVIAAVASEHDLAFKAFSSRSHLAKLHCDMAGTACQISLQRRVLEFLAHGSGPLIIAGEDARGAEAAERLISISEMTCTASASNSVPS